MSPQSTPAADGGPGDASLRAWEEAYERFETPAQEVGKFLRRLRVLEVETWDRDARVVELFCGRGSGLHAWRRLGFRHVEGLDLSMRLLRLHDGDAPRYAADARALPFKDGTRDVVSIQGGLHHLESLADLARVLEEIRRVLRPGGRLVVVEPWSTPFLQLVHVVGRIAPLRAVWPRIDALQTMIEHERATYEAWLGRPEEILDTLWKTVVPHSLEIGWGKLSVVGIRRDPDGG